MKREPRANYQVLDRARDEYLAGARQRSDPSANVNRQTLDVIARQFDLTDVQTGSDLQSQRSDCFDEGQGAADGPRRADTRRARGIADRIRAVSLSAEPLISA